MLRVKVDLVPFGNEDESRQIAEMIIANVSGLDHNAKYFVAMSTDYHPPVFKTTYHDRRDSLWQLIKHAISSTEYGIDEDWENDLARKIKMLHDEL
jgi:hypothetical protein